MILIFGFILLSLALAYSGAMLWLWLGFRRMTNRLPSADAAKSRPLISVVIPARNEERNIRGCLEAVLANRYNRFEVIVADDGSTDQTSDEVESLRKDRALEKRLSLIRLSSSGGKKHALGTAIARSHGEIIVSTDADSRPPNTWLEAIAAGLDDPEVDFLVGPVAYSHTDSFLGRALSLELLGLVAVAGGGIANGHPNMCNGANIAYRRSAFERVGGFEGIDRVASGDDALLMFKIHSDSKTGSVDFCHDRQALVTTTPPIGWREILNQRLRWASKSTEYRNLGVVSLAGFVLAFHVMLLAAGLAALLAPIMLYFWVPALIIKITSEGVLLRSACRYFGRPSLMRVFLPAQAIQIPYVSVVGVLGLLGVGFEWKGRRHRR